MLAILLAVLAGMLLLFSTRRRAQRRAAEAEAARVRAARKKAIPVVSANLRGVTDTQTVTSQRLAANARPDERGP